MAEISGRIDGFDYTMSEDGRSGHVQTSYHGKPVDVTIIRDPQTGRLQIDEVDGHWLSTVETYMASGAAKPEEISGFNHLKSVVNSSATARSVTANYNKHMGIEDPAEAAAAKEKAREVAEAKAKHDQVVETSPSVAKKPAHDAPPVQIAEADPTIMSDAGSGGAPQAETQHAAAPAKVLDPRRPADQQDREDERARLIKEDGRVDQSAPAAGEASHGKFDLSKPYVVEFGKGTKSEGSLRLEKLENGKLMVYRDDHTPLHQLQHGRKRQAALEELHRRLDKARDPGERHALEFMSNVVRDLKPSHRSALAQGLEPQNDQHNQQRPRGRGQGNHRQAMPSEPTADAQVAQNETHIPQGRNVLGTPPLTQANFNIFGS